MSRHNRFPEGLVGNIDCALWDLAGKSAGMSVSRMLGRARGGVKGYASRAASVGGRDEVGGGAG